MQLILLQLHKSLNLHAARGVVSTPPPCGARNYMSRGVLPAVARGFLSIRTLVYARPYLEH